MRKRNKTTKKENIPLTRFPERKGYKKKTWILSPSSSFCVLLVGVLWMTTSDGGREALGLEDAKEAAQKGNAPKKKKNASGWGFESWSHH